MRASLIFAGLLGGGAIALPQHSGDIALPQLPVPGLVRTSSTNPSPEASQPASATEASAETTQLELADKIMPETPELTFATKIIPGNFETATATQTSSETSKPEEEEEEEEEEEDSAVCSLPFKTEDEAKDSWKESGAADFLSEYLDDNGIEDWGNNMLTDTVQGGLMGTTFDCANIEGLQSCGLPEDRKCETYDPPEAYLLHISLANMMAMYHNIYETLVEEQLNVIEDKSKEIEEAFGEPEIEGIFPILIGAFVMGAAAAGPHWQIGAPLGAGIGLLNLAAGLTAQAEDTTDNLKSTMRDTYREVRKNLKTAAEAVSNGDFDGLDVDDPKQYIMDAFDEGQMIHVKQKNTSTQKYLDSFTELLVSNELALSLISATFLDRTNVTLESHPHLQMFGEQRLDCYNCKCLISAFIFLYVIQVTNAPAATLAS